MLLVSSQGYRPVSHQTQSASLSQYTALLGRQNGMETTQQARA